MSPKVDLFELVSAMIAEGLPQISSASCPPRVDTFPQVARPGMTG